MGVLLLDEDDKVKSSGTEIGAFVRLDDLDAGYSFKELDRSHFHHLDRSFDSSYHLHIHKHI